MIRFVLPLLFAATASAQGVKDEELIRKTKTHQKDVTRLRGLEFKKPVNVGAYSKKELLAFIKEELNRELPPDEAELEQRAYAKFGLLPKDMDLYQAILDLFTESVLGFYHPKTKELRLIKPGGKGKDPTPMGAFMERVTFVHELTHAVQDQNFELSTLPMEDETNDDLLLSLKAVIEGDASLVGWKYGLGRSFDQRIKMINRAYKSGEGLPGKAASLPAFLRFQLTFPYGHGGDFVLAHLRASGGKFEAISELYKDFPLSTEQILHPEKYSGERDNPTLITLPDLAKTYGAPWKETLNNVHGEFTLGILLRELGVEEDERTLACEGWDGDRFVTLEDDKKNVMYVWYSTWDTEKDAREFFETYARALLRKYELPEAEPEGKKIRFKTDDGLVLLERRKSDVLVLDGATEKMLAGVGDLWKNASKKEMTSFERVKSFVCASCGVKKAFSGDCPKCRKPLKYQDDTEKKKEKKRLYTR